MSISFNAHTTEYVFIVIYWPLQFEQINTFVQILIFSKYLYKNVVLKKFESSNDLTRSTVNTYKLQYDYCILWFVDV